MRRIGTIFSLSAAVLLLWVGLALAAPKGLLARILDAIVGWLKGITRKA